MSLFYLQPNLLTKQNNACKLVTSINYGSLIPIYLVIFCKIKIEKGIHDVEVDCARKAKRVHSPDVCAQRLCGMSEGDRAATDGYQSTE